MATVTDSSLLSAAQDIVTEFMDNKITLNQGVIKKASDLGLNSDQTQRLIERTNTEAFLRIYPNDTDFEVASPEAILGIKTASITPRVAAGEAQDDGLFKAASAEDTNILRLNDFSMTGIPNTSDLYKQAAAEMDDAEIFGMDEAFFKEAHDTAYAPVFDAEFKEMRQAMSEVQKTAHELEVENAERELRFNDALENFADFVKQASLSGTQSFADGEYELLNMYPEYEGAIRNIYDVLSEKLASAGVFPEYLDRAPDVQVAKFAHETPITRKFRAVMDVVYGE